MLIVALTLCVAGIAKAAMLMDELSASKLSLAETLFTQLLVVFEIGLSWWLASRIKLQIAIKTAIVVVLGFISIVAYKLYQQETSCGCFGVIDVHPAIMLAVDIAMLLVLVRNLKSKLPSLEPVNTRIPVLASVSVVVLLICGWSNLNFERMTGAQVGADALVVAINLSDFKGQQLPLLSTVRQPENALQDLSQGERQVLIVNQECERCQELLNRLVEVANRKNVSFDLLEYNKPRELLRSESFVEAVKVLEKKSAGDYYSCDGSFYYSLVSPTMVSIEGGVIRSIESSPNEIVNMVLVQ